MTTPDAATLRAVAAHLDCGSVFAPAFHLHEPFLDWRYQIAKMTCGWDRHLWDVIHTSAWQPSLHAIRATVLYLRVLALQQEWQGRRELYDDYIADVAERREAYELVKQAMEGAGT